MFVPEDIPRILVVDDERVIRDVLSDFLSLENFFVQTAEDGAAAIEALGRASYDLVLSDLKMPRLGGLDVLQHIRHRRLTTKAVIMTGFGTVETAIDAMKRGAHDYILKPFRMDEVVLTVRRALEEKRLEAENLQMRETIGLYSVSEKIASTLSLDEVLQTVTEAACTATGADAATLLLRDGERLRVAAERHREGSTPLELDLDSLRERVLREGSLRVRGDDAQALAAGDAPEAILAVPVEEADGALLGFLALGRSGVGSHFEEGQRKLTSMLGHRAAAAIVNARLFESLQDTIQQTIQGLARAIDKLDPYTAGHSDRVSLYAGLLADALGLPAEEARRIRQSAQMHDIGKIGCYVNLNKPGKLTVSEYEEFKRHPTFGMEILEPIAFLAPLVPGVHLHHERMDGAGYPLGIPGDSIPLMARIICIADSYDAMTSDRAYRRALTHEIALEELDRCAGSQFDAALVPLFVQEIEAWRARRIEQGWPVPE